MDKWVEGSWEEFEQWIRDTIKADFCWCIRPRDTKANRGMIASLILNDIHEELIGKILKPLKQLEEAIEDPEANPPLTSYCQWADRLEGQFACAEHLVEEGRAFFDPENLERLKSIPLSEQSTRFMRSLHWNGIMAVSKRK